MAVQVIKVGVPGLQGPGSYTLTAATSEALGGIKSGGDIAIDDDGIVTILPPDASTVAACTGSQNLDVGSNAVFDLTVTGDCTLTMTGEPDSGSAAVVVLQITNGGAYTITWDGGIKWGGGEAPTLTEAGIDVITMYTVDGGTSWMAFVSGQDVKEST